MCPETELSPAGRGVGGAVEQLVQGGKHLEKEYQLRQGRKRAWGRRAGKAF